MSVGSLSSRRPRTRLSLAVALSLFAGASLEVEVAAQVLQPSPVPSEAIWIRVV